MTQLVVITEATAERLGRDARLGRLLRVVLLPAAAGAVGMFVLDGVVGSTPATVAALSAVAISLSWESAGPGGRRRRALMAETRGRYRATAVGDCRAFPRGRRGPRRAMISWLAFIAFGLCLCWASLLRPGGRPLRGFHGGDRTYRVIGVIVVSLAVLTVLGLVLPS